MEQEFEESSVQTPPISNLPNSPNHDYPSCKDVMVKWFYCEWEGECCGCWHSTKRICKMIAPWICRIIIVCLFILAIFSVVWGAIQFNSPCLTGCTACKMPLPTWLVVFGVLFTVFLVTVLPLMEYVNKKGSPTKWCSKCSIRVLLVIASVLLSLSLFTWSFLAFNGNADTSNGNPADQLYQSCDNVTRNLTVGLSIVNLLLQMFYLSVLGASLTTICCFT